MVEESGAGQPDARTPTTDLDAMVVTASGEVEPCAEEQTRRRVLSVPAPPHRPSRSMHGPPRPPNASVVVAPPKPSPSRPALEEELDSEEGATVMFARSSAPALEAEATAMWNAQSLPLRASPIDATEVLGNSAPSLPSLHPGARRSSQAPTAAPLAPTTVLASPAQHPLPRAAAPEPLHPGAMTQALPLAASASAVPVHTNVPHRPAPHPPASTARLELLVVVAMFAVAGIGILIGLMLAGRPPSDTHQSPAATPPDAVESSTP